MMQLMMFRSVLSKVAGFSRLRIVLVTLTVLCTLMPASLEAATPKFVIGWSVYAGWNPYFYLAKSGILKRWADKYGIQIQVQRFDYAASLDAFVSKNIDAGTMSKMKALSMPSASGVDSTAIIVGDYSNGNDAVLTRGNISLNQLQGKQIMLVQKTVSEYLLERAMDINHLQSQIPYLRLMNTSDSDIVGAFLGNSSNKVVVTWKPLVSEVLQQDRGARDIFDSSKIPGEILDLLVVRTDVLNRPDGSGVRFAKAITGAWYEAMANMAGSGPMHERALNESAAASDDSPSSYSEQLTTPRLFYMPKINKPMNLRPYFCFHHQLLGEGVQSVDDVAIRYPDGAIQGKKNQVRF